MKEFRLLRADEIEVRIARVTNNALMLLLYKDARCDQNILDETVGCMNWQREHKRDNANCVVSLWDAEKQMWVSKEDTGKESNTEKEKGLASDSFKRACFNWGIGRELYTAPTMFYPKDKANVTNDKCYDKFVVDTIEYNNKRISYIRIKNINTGFIYEPFKLPQGQKDKDIKQKKAEVKKTKADAEIKKQAELKSKRDLISKYVASSEEKKDAYLEYIKANNLHKASDITEEHADALLKLLGESK